MMAAAIRVLYVDDEPDLLDIGRMFLEQSGDFVVTTALSAPEAMRLLEQEQFDAIISDYLMPGMDGIQFLVEVRTRFGAIPFVLFTGRGREEVVIQAINNRADFYLQKGGEPCAQFAELSHTVKSAASRKWADDALQKSEEKYRHLIEHSDEAIVVAQDGMLKLVNHRTAELTGYSEQELLSMPFAGLIHPDDRAMVMEQYQKRIKGGKLPCRYSFRMSPKDAPARWVEISVAAIDWDGRPATLNFLTDITARMRAEEALRESEGRYRNLYKSSRDAIMTLEPPSWRFTSCNPAAVQMFMVRDEAEFISKEPWVLSPEHQPDGRDSGGKAKEMIETAMREGTRFFEWTHRRLNGEDFPATVLLSRVELAGKVFLQATVRDITANRRAEESLRESEERYRNIVEDQTEFICRFLKDGTHVFVNDAYCRYFNRKREELIGHRFRPVLHPEDREMVARYLASITPEHPVTDIEQRIIMPDGSIRWQRWSDRAIFDADGSITEYQSVGRDISEQKELEMEMEYHGQELRKFSASLDAANRKLNLLSGITRHDINNQLTVILGYLDMLESTEHDPALNAYFRTVATAAQRISGMIQFAREYEQIGVLAPAWQDARMLVDAAAMEAPLGQVMVKNELPAGTDVFADPLIVRVFYNLMDNAVRYGEKCTTIRFSAEESGDGPVIVCEDDGAGVSAGEKEQIFERGYGKNTGLGLALAREILSITGITIRETGEPGKGARFEMAVPKGMYRFASKP